MFCFSCDTHAVVLKPEVRFLIWVLSAFPLSNFLSFLLSHACCYEECILLNYKYQLTYYICYILHLMKITVNRKNVGMNEIELLDHEIGILKISTVIWWARLWALFSVLICWPFWNGTVNSTVTFSSYVNWKIVHICPIPHSLL